MIFAKLAEIQKNLFVPKGQKNDFGKYNYRSCEDILKTVKPLLAEQNCTLYLNNDMVHIGELNYVKATAVLVDLETGEHIESTAHAREEATKKGMDGSQISGASSSYARKYALAGLFCIDNEKDSDATNTGDSEASQSASRVSEADLRARVIAYANRELSPEVIKKQCEYYKVESLNQLSAAQCKAYIQSLEKKGVKV